MGRQVHHPTFLHLVAIRLRICYHFPVRKSDLRENMAAPSVKLTKRTVDSLSVSTGDAVFWDRDLPGFGIRVYATGRKMWCVQVRDRSGKPRRVGLGLLGKLSPDQARKKAVEVIDRLRQGLDPEPPPEVREPTVAEFAERYVESHVRANCKPNTIAGVTCDLRLHILPAIGHLRLSEVEPSHAADLHHELRDRPGLANRVVSVLSTMFGLAETWGVTPPRPNPCRSIRRFRDEPRERFLSPEEYRKLARALDEGEENGSLSSEAAAAIRLLMLTGCRKNEILKLKWDDVDRAAGEIRLRDSKTGLRHVPLTPAIEAVLSGIPRREDGPWVIPGRNTGSHLRSLNPIWVRVCGQAGVKDARLHDLRHSYASRALALGEGFPVIGKLLGHRHISTTARYAHLMRDAERASAARVGASLGFLMPRPEAPGKTGKAAKTGKAKPIREAEAA